MEIFFKEIRATCALALPIVTGQVSQMIIGITDNFMIGKLGTVPFGAAAFGSGVFMFVFIVCSGLLAPAGVLIAREFGGGNWSAASMWLREGVQAAVVTSLVGLAVMFGLIPLFGFMRQDPLVLAEVRPFYDLVAVSLVPTLLFLVFRQFSESMGRPWLPMAVMLFGVLLNVFLNWVFIYGNLGAPKWGVAGAGFATLISRTACLVILILLVQRSSHLMMAWPVKWLGKMSWQHVREFWRIGIPMAAALAFESGAFTMLVFLMGAISKEALAAHQIAVTCIGFTFMFPLGLAMAVGVRVGRVVGEGRAGDVRAVGFGALSITWILMTMSALLFWLAGPWLAGWFSVDPKVLELAKYLLIIGAIFQIFDGTQVVASGALRGLLDVKVPSLVVFFAYWVVTVPLGWLLGIKLDIGGTGPWIAMAVGLSFAAVGLSWRLWWKSGMLRAASLKT